MTDKIDLKFVDALFDEAYEEAIKAQKERDIFRAELDLLKEAHRYCDETLRKQQARWSEEHAEVERLRAALQEIVDHPAPSHVYEVAREALGNDKCD